MRRAITGFHPDAEGEWVAELECGHNQHVRHRPPFQERPWVTTSAGRAGRQGTPLECPLCDRAELPDALVAVRSTPVWDQDTMPAALRREHRVASGQWGRLVVDEGRLSFRAGTAPPLDVVVEAGSVQPIPPGVGHSVEPLGDVRFWIEFLAIGRARGELVVDEGGDPSCWADEVCPSCGGLGDDGHRPGCDAAG